MAIIGYTRVSTHDQTSVGQVDMLEAHGCDRIFQDTASGALAQRPALQDMLDYVRSGDTLVITKLDRLGRSVKSLKELVDDLDARGVNLRVLTQGVDTGTPGGRLFFHVLAAIAEFERDLIVERTKEGLAAARARGRRGGRRPTMSTVKVGAAQKMYAAGDMTVQEIAETLGVSRSTVYRHLDPAATAHACAVDRNAH